MNTRAITIAICAAAAGSTCWAADESRLDLKYGRVVQAEQRPSGPAATAAAATAPPKARACTVLIQAPGDQRRNKDTLGTTFADNPIVSNQSPTTWLQAALMDLTRQGFGTMLAPGSGDVPATRVATLSVDLDRLYIWNHSLNLHATVVINASIVGGGGETLIRRYRVNSTKLNWWNADSEFVDTLNLAAARLLEQMADDIEGVCSNKRGA